MISDKLFKTELDNHIEIVRKKIDSIDFSQIKLQLIHRKGYSYELAEDAVEKYKAFLCCIVVTKNLVSPGKVVDEVWHIHILNTKQYTEDCKNLTGKYIHHNPVFLDESGNKVVDIEESKKSQEEYVKFLSKYYEHSLVDFSSNGRCRADCDSGEQS